MSGSERRFRLKDGFTLSPRRPWCDAPVVVSILARRRVKRSAVGVALHQGQPAMELVAYHPCRQCGKCRLIRKWQWEMRMKYETTISERTWFVTLTLSAKARADMNRQVAIRANNDRVLLRERERWQYQDEVMYDWVRDYLKRCRYHFEAWGGARLRFVSVSEAHKDGTPHMHLLMHTKANITYRLLRRAKWGHGFVDARLADAETSEYLTKYLTKQAGRVRASQWYGDSARVLAADLHSIEDSQSYASEAPPTTRPFPTRAEPSHPARASDESSDTEPKRVVRKRTKRPEGAQSGASEAKPIRPIRAAKLR